MKWQFDNNNLTDLALNILQHTKLRIAFFLTINTNLGYCILIFGMLLEFFYFVHCVNCSNQ